MCAPTSHIHSNFHSWLILSLPAPVTLILQIHNLVQYPQSARLYLIIINTAVFMVINAKACLLKPGAPLSVRKELVVSELWQFDGSAGRQTLHRVRVCAAVFWGAGWVLNYVQVFGLWMNFSHGEWLSAPVMRQVFYFFLLLGSLGLVL